MSIASTTNTTGLINDKISSSSVSVKADNNEVTKIKSVEALENAEQKGTKVTIGDQQVVKNIERALKAIQGPETSFEMSMHEKTHTIVIKVLNKETGELIREIPPEKTLDLIAKFMEINGMLIDEKV